MLKVESSHQAIDADKQRHTIEGPIGLSLSLSLPYVPDHLARVQRSLPPRSLPLFTPPFSVTDKRPSATDHKGVLGMRQSGQAERRSDVCERSVGANGVDAAEETNCHANQCTFFRQTYRKSCKAVQCFVSLDKKLSTGRAAQISLDNPIAFGKHDRLMTRTTRSTYEPTEDASENFIIIAATSTTTTTAKAAATAFGATI